MWNSGDQVMLKSGGPVMTVNYVHNDIANCVWFSGKKMESGNFKINTLKSAPEDDDGDK